MNPQNTYAALFAAVQHFVQHYRTDFDHDLRLITANPGVPFLHWTRTCGTWLTFLQPFDHPYWPAKGVEVPYLFGTATREHIADQIVAAARHSAKNPETLATHHFDGKTLHKISAARSLDIAEDHRRHLLHHWKRQCCAS